MTKRAANDRQASVTLLERSWYSTNVLTLLLLPLSWLFAAIAMLRRAAYRSGLLRRQRFDVPVIVVGNITVGGTGKTPLVIWLADYLRAQGWHPGIVSRGYGGKAGSWPQQVRPDSDPASVGDEAVMLAARTGCPMCVGPDRPEAIRALLRHREVDIVISDDGLQHYGMRRDLEIVVLDGTRRLGNGFLLPAGPLREPRSRLKQVDLVIVNGGDRSQELTMTVDEPRVRSLKKGDAAAIGRFAGRRVHAVAGIGNPQRFFDLLMDRQIEIQPHVFADHHAFSADDLRFGDDLPILMTEKDAVKCRRLPCHDAWIVLIDVQPDEKFVHQLNNALKDITDGQKITRHPGVPEL